MEELLRILNEIKPGVDFANEQSIISDGILDSMDIVRLVVDLSDEFDVTITPADIIPENFETVEAMANMIRNLDGEI